MITVDYISTFYLHVQKKRFVKVKEDAPSNKKIPEISFRDL